MSIGLLIYLAIAYLIMGASVGLVVYLVVDVIRMERNRRN